jgi:hypothetical protein
MPSESETAADLPTEHKRIALKWLMFEHGMTVEEAATTIEEPTNAGSGLRDEAISVAVFVLDGLS